VQFGASSDHFDRLFCSIGRYLSGGNHVRIGIVITNCNYGDHLGATIDSALGVDWPEKEIIVVDDGSTDHSPAVISAYGNRIKAFLKPNGGQNSAANIGFVESSADIIFFLDSDDTLMPQVARRIVPLFKPTTTKVQFPLVSKRPDGSGAGLYPRFPAAYSASDVKRSVAATGSYVSSPTSGNAWPRWVLEKAFPLPTRWTEAVPAEYFDGYLSAIASKLGDVVTVSEPLGTYYINPKNMWTTRFSPKFIAAACLEDSARSEYINGKLRSLGLRPIQNSPFTQWMKRLVSRKYCSDASPVHERQLTLLLRSLRSVGVDPGLGIKSRLLIMAWMIAIVVLPHGLALPLVKLRFVQGYRPKLVNWLLTSRRHRVGLRTRKLPEL
jgi:glycosyltransferase involved in cell wall biosynthesis